MKILFAQSTFCQTHVLDINFGRSPNASCLHDLRFLLLTCQSKPKSLILIIFSLMIYFVIVPRQGWDIRHDVFSLTQQSWNEQTIGSQSLSLVTVNYDKNLMSLCGHAWRMFVLHEGLQCILSNKIIHMLEVVWGISKHTNTNQFICRDKAFFVKKQFLLNTTKTCLVAEKVIILFVNDQPGKHILEERRE